MRVLCGQLPGEGKLLWGLARLKKPAQRPVFGPNPTACPPLSPHAPRPRKPPWQARDRQVVQRRQHQWLQTRVVRLAAALSLDPTAPDPPLLGDQVRYAAGGGLPGAARLPASARPPRHQPRTAVGELHAAGRPPRQQQPGSGSGGGEAQQAPAKATIEADPGLVGALDRLGQLARASRKRRVALHMLHKYMDEMSGGWVCLCPVCRKAGLCQAAQPQGRSGRVRLGVAAGLLPASGCPSQLTQPTPNPPDNPSLHGLFCCAARIADDTAATHVALARGAPVDLVAAGQRFQARMLVSL